MLISCNNKSENFWARTKWELMAGDLYVCFLNQGAEEDYERKNIHAVDISNRL